MNWCAPTTREELAGCLEDVRSLLEQCVLDLDEDALVIPYDETLNPFLWELGHVAWFLEHWVLVHCAGLEAADPEADRLWDSTTIAHRDRWKAELADAQRTRRYVDAVFERALERLRAVDLQGDELYFQRLALFHADMHVEAFLYMRQTLGLRAPAFLAARSEDDLQDSHAGETEYSGGSLLLGAPTDAPFWFDNERGHHEIHVAPFRLDRTTVSQERFREFVEDRGYERRELWTEAGWTWRRASSPGHPRYWRRDGSGWQQRSFERWAPLEAHLPVHHVCAHEADAFARWSGRRLPTEAEWEFAAGRSCYPWGEALGSVEHACLDLSHRGPRGVSGCAAGDCPQGTRQLWGNVWEWTSTAFAPYPGFQPGPYRQYSEPWFGDHRVLRGGSFATRSRLLRSSWRNFYLPSRSDLFAGFRTAASLR